MLYLPDVKEKVVEFLELESASPCIHEMQSAIHSNLREIQQEEEIIFWEPVHNFQPNNE
jgi:hypothetical protein